MNKINEITDFIGVLIIAVIISAGVFHTAWFILWCMYFVGFLIYIWVLFKISPSIYSEIKKNEKFKPFVPKKHIIAFFAVLGVALLLLGIIFGSLLMFMISAPVFILCMTVSVCLLSVRLIENES